MATTAKKTTANSNAATATAAIESAAAAGSDMFKDSFERMMKSVSDMTEFQKETFEAFVESAQTFSKGVETISTETMAFQKKAMEDGVAAAKSASTAKSLQDVIETNTDFVKTSFEAFVGQMNKMNDVMTNTVKDAGEPVNERYTAFVEMVQSYRP
ncbi:MAG: phasin family protein [Pseudomonadota bacterium]